MSITRVNQHLIENNIHTPVISLPINYTQNYDGTVVVGNMSTSFNFTGAHTATSWEMATDLTFSVILSSSYNDSINLINWTSTALPINTDVYIRCKFHAGVYVSDWSTASISTTPASAASFIETPMVGIQGGPQLIPESPLITSSPFVSVNSLDTHISTSWSITTLAGGVVWSSNNDVANLLSIKIPFQLLLQNTQYIFSVVYNSLTMSSSAGISSGRTMVSFVKTYNGTWTNSTVLPVGVKEHAQSDLFTGGAFITGGNTSTLWTAIPSYSTYEYIPSQNIWVARANLPLPLRNHAQSTLSNGNVVVSGGVVNGSVSNAGTNFNVNVVNVYNPASNSWSLAGSLSTSVQNHAQVTLNNGSVLVTGGEYLALPQPICEIYDPSVNSWKRLLNLSFSIHSHSMNVLNDGTVMIIGGVDLNGITAAVYILDLVLNTLTLGVPLPVPLKKHRSTTLSNGNVLVTGGSGVLGTKNNVYEYDITTNLWNTKTPLIAFTESHGQSLLGDGSVLYTGGTDGTVIFSATNIYQ